MEGGTLLGVAQMVNGTGYATLPLLDPGQHQITGLYSGDANWAPSTSPIFYLTIIKIATNLDISTTRTAGGSDGASITARLISNASSAGAPSGLVSFVEAVSQRTLATAPVNGGTATALLPPDAGSNAIVAVYEGDSRFESSRSAPAAGFAVVNAASYARTALAPNEIVTMFCPGLSAQLIAAPALPLPAALGGVSLSITDSTGITLPAMLYYVSPTQVAFLVPPDVALGMATLRIATAAGNVAAAAIRIAAVAPGLFSAASDGRGLAAAQIVRGHSDGTVDQPEAVAIYDSITQTWLPAPVAAADGEQLNLVLYGTGIRDRSVELAVTVNSQMVPVSYAGAQGTYLGLDQINIGLPLGLPPGEVKVSMTVDGVTSNTVTLVVR
jgi:uncharacterized protein (TIGR03437 family)